MATRQRKYRKRPPMTAGRLYRELGLIIKKHGDRIPVAIDKRTFTHPLEADGCCMLDVHDVVTKYITIMDDDGGTKTTKAGREVGKVMLLMIGWESNPEPEGT